jgi:hypothetical protein
MPAISLLWALAGPWSTTYPLNTAGGTQLISERAPSSPTFSGLAQARKGDWAARGPRYSRLEIGPVPLLGSDWQCGRSLSGAQLPDG